MAEPTYKIIKVADLIPTPDNPRIVRTDSESFRTLADSVKAEGVRIPVIARPHPKKKGKYDLIAGARRHAAAKLAKLKSIPVLVYEDMSDEAAFDLTFLENFAREDLTVLEEAQAVATLLEKNKGDVKAVADKFDKSEKWIRLRANVHGNLSDKWLEAIGLIGEIIEDYDRLLVRAISNFGIGHFALIARFDKTTQDGILEEVDLENITIDELGKECDDLLMDLSAATWDPCNLLEIDDPKVLRPGTEVLKMTGHTYLRTCADCHRRTGYQPLLWEDDPKKAKVDRCLDRACWKEHITAAMAEKIATAKVKHEGLKLLTTEQGYTENREIAKAHGDLLESSDVQTANKSDKEAFPCFVVRGKQAGKVVWRKKPKGRPGSTSRSSKGPKSMETKRQELNSKRWYSMIDVIRPMVEEAPLESIQHEDKLLAVMAIIAHIGFDSDNNVNEWDDFDEAMGKDRDFVLGQLWPGIRDTIADNLTHVGPITKMSDEKMQNTYQVIKLLGLDYDKLWADAMIAHPEPAAWAIAKATKKVTPKKKMKVKKKVKKAAAACG